LHFVTESVYFLSENQNNQGGVLAMQLRARAFGLIIGGALLAPLTSVAATVTDLVTFSANSFNATGGTVPTDPVNGSFTITFDPTQTYTDSTSGITLNGLNISLGSSLAFDYSPTSQTVDGVTYLPGELVVGGITDGAGMVQFSPATDDFWLFVNTFATSPTFLQVGYAQVAAGNNLFFTTNGTGSVSVAPVPLPAAAWLMVSGLVGLGALRRRRAA
jgi:hypothetical protein